MRRSDNSLTRNLLRVASDGQNRSVGWVTFTVWGSARTLLSSFVSPLGQGWIGPFSWFFSRNLRDYRVHHSPHASEGQVTSPNMVGGIHFQDAQASQVG